MLPLLLRHDAPLALPRPVRHDVEDLGCYEEQDICARSQLRYPNHGIHRVECKYILQQTTPINAAFPTRYSGLSPFR